MKYKWEYEETSKLDAILFFTRSNRKWLKK